MGTTNTKIKNKEKYISIALKIMVLTILEYRPSIKWAKLITANNNVEYSIRKYISHGKDGTIFTKSFSSVSKSLNPIIAQKKAKYKILVKDKENENMIKEE